MKTMSPTFLLTRFQGAVLAMMLLLTACGGGVGPVSPTDSSDAAIAAAVKLGYGDCNTDNYLMTSQFHVLLCTGAVNGQLFALFFQGATYVGKNADAPSGKLEVIWRQPETVALLYGLYRPGDQLCCPTAGASVVRYQLKGSQVLALDPLPSQKDLMPR